ncbi:MAG: metallophosphoesterase [Candidatus Caldatribacteriota bacterium]|nr:metallophosphoesterase [Candidatus Caldatribacteriota bacterium]
MHYVIGDVHGSLESLKMLIQKLPNIEQLYFVGDLIDRGPDSKGVVDFIRKHNFQTVLGNHEQFMIEDGQEVINRLVAGRGLREFDLLWTHQGGRQTLESYGFKYTKKGNIKLGKATQTDIDTFMEHINWMKTLPYYIETGIMNNGRQNVISHSSVSRVWEDRFFLDNSEKFDRWEGYVLWGRKPPIDVPKIFNIFGHTKVRQAEVTKYFANIDTGCYSERYGKLSAYCLENGKIYEQERPGSGQGPGIQIEGKGIRWNRQNQN